MENKARLSTKGQIVLPLNIRTARNWKAGAEFRVEETPEGILLRPVRHFPKARLEDVAGCLLFRGKPKTLAQMDAAIVRTVKQRDDRSRY